MIAPLLFALAVPALSTPSPSPTPPAALALWKKAPLAKDEYAHYTRIEPDGTQSEITASRQVCDCQPPHLVQMLNAALAPVKGVTTAVDAVSICGGTQPRFTATGLASLNATAHNMQVIAFRKEPALYVLQYNFNAPKPAADVIAALAAFCP